jgi:signal transduction histidine kinase
MTVQPVFDSPDRTAAHQSGSYARTSAPPPLPSEPPAVDAVERSRNDASSHIRTQLLRRIAHDIASPTGVTTTALEELANDGVAPRPELLAMARRGLRRLLRLSEQLALVAELESAAIVPESTPEDIAGVATSAIDQALAIDGRRGISANFVPPAERIFVEVDRRLLTSVIREVVGNALRIAKSTVRVSVEATKTHAIVRIEDDGPGFSEPALAAVGQRFTPNASARGLGLSLSIAQDVVVAHHGELRFGGSDLPPGRTGGPHGASVSIVLPLPAR